MYLDSQLVQDILGNSPLNSEMVDVGHVLMGDVIEVPEKNHRLTPSHWQLSHMPPVIFKYVILEYHGKPPINHKSLATS